MQPRNCGKRGQPLPVLSGNVLLALVGGTLLTHLGCSSPTDPPAPPTGGSEFVLDFRQFESSVYPILSRHGCDAEGACHGGGIRGTLVLSPQDDKDSNFDFQQVVLQVDGANPVASPLLTKPLAVADGGTAHSYEGFLSTSDEDYQAILAWIEDGKFQ